MTYSQVVLSGLAADALAALALVGVTLVRRHNEHAAQHRRDEGEPFDPLRDLTETVNVARPQHPLLHHCQGVVFESRVRPARQAVRAITAAPHVEPPLATPEPPADICDYLAVGDRLQIITVPGRSGS